MYTNKRHRSPVWCTVPLALAPTGSNEFSAIARRVGRVGALSLAALLSAPLPAAPVDNAVAHASPPLASPSPSRLIQLAQAAAEKSSIPATVLPKLDAQLVLGLKKSRGEPPYDKVAAPEPDIPIKDGARVLVDIDATVSKELLEQIALAGGQLARSPDAAHVVRVMIPLVAVEVLASRPDVNFVAPAKLSFESKPLMPSATTGTVATKP